MSASRLKLSKFIAQRQLVVLSRRFVKEGVEGFVVGVGEQFVLLHLMDNCHCLNGYCAIRLSDIQGCRRLVKHDHIAERVLKLRGQIPIPLPQISLDDLSNLLLSANKSYPLVTIFKEKIDPEVCCIGKVAGITEKTMTLDEIDPAAKWTRTRRYRLDDITRVDIGGLYEDALLLAASDGRQRRRSRKASM